MSDKKFSVVEYNRRAEDCERSASEAKNDTAKTLYTAAALEWRGLAELVQRKSEQTADAAKSVATLVHERVDTGLLLKAMAATPQQQD